MPRTPADVRDGVRSIVATLSRGARFADSDDVFTAGLLRSVELMALITDLEDAFGIEVTERDVFEGHLRSVDRLVSFIVAPTERA